MSNTKPKVGILYWGNRGGGKVLSEQLFDEAKLEGYEVTYFRRPTRSMDSGRSIPVYYFRTWFAVRKKVVESACSEGLEVVVLPMASPWDIFLGRKLIRRGIRVSRIIHDASPHPGDVFPPQFWIRVLCSDSNFIVTLSKHVANQLISKGYISEELVVVGQLPIPKLDETNPTATKLPRTKFLFIGRGRRYKGLANLLSVWPKVGDESTHLTIAGEGHRVSKHPSRITHVDKWLSDLEVIDFINRCDVVVLPYIEASQSGLVPIAHSLLRPVVVTPVGGLVEQIEDKVDGIIARDSHPDSLVDALREAITMEFDFNKYLSRKQDKSLISLCLTRPDA